MKITKAIKPEMKNLKNKYVVTTQKNLTTDYTEIQNAITKVNVNIDNKNWTNNISNEVNIIATLVSSNEKYNLFKNPTIEIELPEYVEKVVIGDTYLLNANGLSVKNTSIIDKENGKKSILVNIEGSQTEYLLDNMIEGTNVVIPATIILEKEFASKADTININYNNEVGNTNENGTSEIAVNLESIIESKTETSETEEDKPSNSFQEAVSDVSQIELIKQNNGLTIDMVAKVGDEIVARAGTDEANNVQNGVVYERQVIQYKVTLTNNTENVISNISVIGEVPNYTNYATIEHGIYWSDSIIYDYKPDENVSSYQLENIDTLKPGETKSGWYEVLITDLEDGLNNANILNNIVINVGEEKYETYQLNNEIRQAKVDVKLKSQMDREGDDTFVYQIVVTNLTGDDLNNVYIETSNIPKELEFVRSKVMDYQNTLGDGEIEDNKFKITIDNIKANETTFISVRFKGVNYDDRVNEVELKTTAKANVGDDIYISNENRLKAYPQYVTAIMTLDKEGQEVHYGDELTYTVTVKNESKVKTLINISSNLPKELDGIEATYSCYDVGEDIQTEYDIEKEANTQYDLIDKKIDLSIKSEGKDDIYIPTVLPAGKTLTLTIKATAGYVDQTVEVSNFVTVYGRTIKTVVSNIAKVKVLTEVDWDTINTPDEGDDGDDGDNGNNGDVEKPDIPEGGDGEGTENPKPPEGGDEENPKEPIEKKYSISGTVWLDENEDGRKIASERRLTEVVVKLFNADTNSIVVIDNNKMTVKVNENGEYVFNNIPKGKYYCLFEYDSASYDITTYQKSGIISSANNDVSKAEVSIDGIVKNVGITDILKIENSNLTNIDLGLIERKIFDLKLEKYISKVTVSGSKKDKQYTYDNKSLAKVEIPSKNIEGSVVTIEYKFIITNEGNIPGYANEITDYLPKELIFTQDKNKGWTHGKEGNIKNTSLASTSIEPGESKTILLYLTKPMTKQDTGIIKNTAEITQSSNTKNLKDKDSIPGNKSDKEDDYSSADIIISITTGFYRNIMIILLIMGVIILLIKFMKKHNNKLPRKKLPMIMMVIVMMGVMVTNISYGYTENITWEGSGGRLSNGWRCTAAGDHQCRVGYHEYNCYEDDRVPDDSNTEVIKDVKLSKSGSPSYKYLNSEYDIVGPYKVTSNHNIKSSEISPSVGTVCDSRGESIQWTSGTSFTFYVKVPKFTSAVTSVNVSVTVENVIFEDMDVIIYEVAECVSVGGPHHNGAGRNVSITAKDCQTAGKSRHESYTGYQDGTVSVTFGAVYAGSLKILKKDVATGKTIAGSSGAEFTIKDSAGHTIKTGVKIGEVVKGLPQDTYTIKETKAPNGYKLELQKDTTETVYVTDRQDKCPYCGATDISVNAETGNLRCNFCRREFKPEKIQEVEFLNQKYTNIEIKKEDSDDHKAIEGIGFTIYDNHYGKYINASGQQTSSPVTLYTNSNGLIHVQNILLYGDGSTFTIKEVASKNLYYKADTSVTGTISGQSNGTTSWSTKTLTNRKPYYLNIVKQDPDMKSEKLTAYFYIQYEDGTWLTQSGGYSSSQSSITVNNSITIPKIKRGAYHIYEYKTPIGYDITQQDNYVKDKNWVDCGISYVGVNNGGAQDNNVCNITVTRNNKKYISKIRGFVWVDNKSGKLNSFDYVYSSDDIKLSGIKVDFMKTSGEVIKSTTTGSDGGYEFSFFREILYWDLQNYMIRFTYDNQTYTVVPIKTEASESNASRAIENHDWSSDKLATGSGKATSIPNAKTLNDSIAKYYNVNNYCVETINLGLMIKPTEEFSIIENIEYVKLEKGDYEFTYDYKNDAVAIENVPERQFIYDTVALQNSERSFTQHLYPSDIAYNNTVKSNKFEVYVVYKISITNTMTVNMDDLYVEKNLNINYLKSRHREDMYEVSDSDWQEIGSGEAKYNKTINAIPSGGKTDILIQFKVTENGLQQLIQGGKTNPEFYKECATTAIADGYHKYDRNDYSWGYSPNSYQQKNEHQTKEETRASSALSLKLQLAKQRTISGNVFEDIQTPESKRNNTRVGDGKYDENENEVTSYTVELLNTDESIALLYSTEGEYLKQSGEGIWSFTEQEAKVEVKENGNYTLEGVIPGKYYLRFTYGDGTQIVIKTATSTSSNKIELMKYKSTILNENVANNSEDNWYLKVMGGNNSIATDKWYFASNSSNREDIIEKRTRSESEINYSNQNSFNKGKIQAYSAMMNIKFEYLEGTEYDRNHPFISNCEGMCFGIIERPYTDITLNKTISNVKLTLSNGTTIINGNPKDQNISSYLTSINDSYAKVEMDNEYLYGSTVTVTYKIKVTNKSELDYATEEYYTKGHKGNSDPVKTAVTKLIDYISDSNCIYKEVSENIKKVSSDEYDKTIYFDDINKNKDYEDQLLGIIEYEYLLPKCANSNESSTDYYVTVDKLVSNDQDDLGWESYSEIIGLQNVTFAAQYTSHMGNYKAGDRNPYPTGTSETDNGDSTIAVTPSTGENRSYTIYIVAGTVLIVLASGIVIIKKFVL